MLNSNAFELLCKVCYWNFLLMVFAVSLQQHVLISCGAKCYFSKPGHQLFYVVFLEKIENHKFSFFFFFFHSWSIKCRTFLRMALKWKVLFWVLSYMTTHATITSLNLFRMGLFCSTWGRGDLPPLLNPSRPMHLRDLN